MEKYITCLIAGGSRESMVETVSSLKTAKCVGNIFVVGGTSIEGTSPIPASYIGDSQAIHRVAYLCDTRYLLIHTTPNSMTISEDSLERFYQVAEETGAAMLYSDFLEEKEGVLSPHPVIDYQQGSVRDDFNFGSILFCRTSLFRRAAAEAYEYCFAAIYDIRLRLSERGTILRIPETLYKEKTDDTRLSGLKIFDYVNPRYKDVQREMERACTAYLCRAGAWLPERQQLPDYEGEKFDIEASVIIPVRNRAKTIADAVNSALNQKTDFPFNIIVVDNHSTDGTTEILKELSQKGKKVIHIIPESTSLGIGGCWNLAIENENCGRYCVQLDSDDLYIDENVLSKVVCAFHQQMTAAIVGTYKIVDFNLGTLPPGIIDHKEWTKDNGHNNALRINGFGAPRAFYTPIIRRIKFPNTSYGEDYSAMLAISREFLIGRIYEPLYLCRRWDGNSDAALSVEKENANNLYKDRIRTFEIIARKKINEQFNGNEAPI